MPVPIPMSMPMSMTPLQTASLVDSLLAWPAVLSLVPLGIAIWWVWKRTQSGDDPSGSLVFESETGSFSLLISGAYWVAALVAVAAFLMWDTLMAFPSLWVLPVGVVGAAWWLERQEAGS